MEAAMELRHLRYFIAVAEEGSLTLAAEKKAAHGAAFPQPPNARSRIRGWRPVDEPQRARHRIDRRRSGFSRPCTAGADAGRCRGRSGTQGGATGKEDVRHRFPNRARDELAAEAPTSQERRRSVESWLPFLDTYRTMCLAPHPEFEG